MNNINQEHKFWKTVEINELINEIIQPDDVNITSIKISDNLNPIFWDEVNGEFILKPEIRKKLLLNVKYFIDFSNLDGFTFHDIILTGSIANYNYTSYSDVDLHIVFDFNQISEDKEFVSEYFKLKKEVWNNKLPIKIFEHDVEIYVQDSTEPHKSTGIYSVYYNKWLVKPIKKIVNIDTIKLKEKSSYFMNEIDKLNEIVNINNFMIKYNQLKNKIKNYRIKGLETGGEFSTENLVFKVLRNNGYLDKMREYKNDFIAKELSV